MGNIVNTISTEVTNGKRKVKVRRKGKFDIQSVSEVSPVGIDSNPVKSMRAVYMETDGQPVILGYVNSDQLAETGEIRLYATDDDGVTQIFVWLKKDGTLQLGGDADNAVRFSKLKEAFDELQQSVTTLKNVFSTWVPVPNDGGAALKAAAASWAGTALVKDIDAAKIDEITTL